MPVEQLEMAVPQGYGLFIKTVLQAGSFAEPLQLHFQVHAEYLACVARTPASPAASSRTDLLSTAFSHSSRGDEVQCY